MIVAAVILEAIFILVLGVAFFIIYYMYADLHSRIDETRKDLAKTNVNVTRAENKAQRAMDKAIVAVQEAKLEAKIAAETQARTVAKAVVTQGNKEQEDRIHEEMGHLNRVLFEATSQLRAFTHPTDFDFAGRPVVEHPKPKEDDCYEEPPCW